MFDNIISFFKKMTKKENKNSSSKEQAKERLHLVLMQDRANVSADFLDLMKQEIIEVIKKYIEVDESSIDVRLTNKDNGDGTTGAPALYANIPITKIKENAKSIAKSTSNEEKSTESIEEKNEPEKQENNTEKGEIEEKSENVEDKEIVENSNKDQNDSEKETDNTTKCDEEA